MQKEININNKKIEIIIKIILCLSCPFLTLLVSNTISEKFIVIGSILSFIIFSYIIFKKVEIKKININKLIVSIFLSGYILKRYFPYFEEEVINLIISMFKTIHLNISINTSLQLICLIANFSLIFFIYLFIDKIIPYIIKFFNSFTKSEKTYFILTTIIGIIASLFITKFTTGFSCPKNADGSISLYDAVYISDTGHIVSSDSFFDVSGKMNDIRQPLFGVFALPFSVSAKLITEATFFIKNGYEYTTVLMVIQFILFSIMTIMIARMLKLKEKYKKYLYIFFACSYPNIIWTITIEQYSISTFYLILALYVYFEKIKTINYTYISAVGTLLTSGIIFPIITKFKNIKQWIKDVFKCFLAFISITIISGQLPLVMDGYNQMSTLISRSGGLDVSFVNKLKQYFEFLKGIFITTNGYRTIGRFTRAYFLHPISHFWYLGILIIILCILGYWLNRKNKFVKVSLLWIIFSFFITVIIGWGTKEKCLLLYGLYFSWAYLTLIFMLIKKIFKNYKIFRIIIILLSIIMLYFSMLEFIQIFKFFVEYYPVVI